MTLSISAAAPAVSEWHGNNGEVAPHYRHISEALQAMGAQGQAERWEQARRLGELEAFTFYLDPRRYRPAPADWIPRIIPMEHWEVIAKGVAQRLKAINQFTFDLYNGTQDIVPDEVMFTSYYYYPEVQGFRPPKDLFIHIYGIDLVHLGGGRYVILEDNLRIPSGITYQLKSRDIVERQFPEFSAGYDIVPYDIRQTYLDLFRSLCDTDAPACVLLTDGKFGSAFFEHRYLSELLDLPLVEGSDLYTGYDGRIYARTMDQDYPVDLIYRRVEDLELFVPGLREAYVDGKVALVNAVGTGAADDKLVFLWVPEMIRRYLGEEPALEQAASYNLQDPASRRYALENLDRLVVKSRQGYGGIGVFVMPDLGPTYKSRITQNILNDPHMFIAQETLDFSQHLVFNGERGQLEPHPVDLRVFAVQNGYGEVTVLPGGLTRVALAGGRITNNSSGGLCKPTWVVR